MQRLIILMLVGFKTDDLLWYVLSILFIPGKLHLILLKDLSNLLNLNKSTIIIVYLSIILMNLFNFLVFFDEKNFKNSDLFLI